MCSLCNGTGIRWHCFAGADPIQVGCPYCANAGTVDPETDVENLEKSIELGQFWRWKDDDSRPMLVVNMIDRAKREVRLNTTMGEGYRDHEMVCSFDRLITECKPA